MSGPPAEPNEPDGANLERLDDFLAAYVADNDPFLIDHTLQITSFGGVATTALSAYFIGAGLSLPRGPGQWPFKHRRTPPTADEIPEGYRVLYVVGDPRNAVLSIFRRNYQVGHYGSMSDEPATGDVAAALESLDGYLACDTDLFDFAGHVQGWRDHPSGYPVMFLRHEALHDHWAEVMSFVGLDPTSPPLRRVDRFSDWQSEPDAVQSRLDALHGELARAIEAWPPFEVI